MHMWHCRAFVWVASLVPTTDRVRPHIQRDLNKHIHVLLPRQTDRPAVRAVLSRGVSTLEVSIAYTQPSS